MNITVIVPVYGESPWLKDALNSVLEQDSNAWKLIIADDGSNQYANQWLDRWKANNKGQGIKITQRQVNIGLFGNLNEAIKETETDWIIILCSDDKLLNHAISKINRLSMEYSSARIILSTFGSINQDGTDREQDSKYHHDQLTSRTSFIEPSEMIPGLLKLGSLNGNLTGMAFKKDLWNEIGPFRNDWRHAADWEWLIRAAEKEAILVNRDPIAQVRTHKDQLSNKNRVSGHETQEVSQVVKLLIDHPLMADEAKKTLWAGHIMQFQLWNLMKKACRGHWRQCKEGLNAIHRSAGMRQTIVSLITWLPNRWEKRKRHRPK